MLTDLIREQQFSEQVFCNILSSYRMIFALYDISTLETNTPEYKAAIEEFRRVFPFEMSEASISATVCMLYNWTRYVMKDMLYYLGKIGVKDIEEWDFNETYMKRMRDQQLFLKTNNKALFKFRTMDKPPVILDIGCGLGHARQELLKANPGAEYYGVDLRHSDSALNIVKDDVLHFLSNISIEFDCLYMSEFLHCIPEPLNMLDNILKLVPSVQHIKIIEIAPRSALDLGFGYHMFLHANSNRFNLSDLQKWAVGKDVMTTKAMLNSQHRIVNIIKTEAVC